MNEFKLLKENARWWSLSDYAAVVAAMKKTKARRVLEFGPGSSTLALIEGGAESVDTCEDQEDWAKVYEERLAKRFPEPGFPTVVRLHRFTWPEGALLSIPAVDGEHFDLALIDGPHGTERRPDVIRYALERCTHVLVSLEESESARPFLRPAVKALGKELGRPVKITETGPDAGAFALIGPAKAKKAATPKTPKAPRAKKPAGKPKA